MKNIIKVEWIRFKLDEILKNKNITQYRLAKEVGFSQPNLNKLIREWGNMNLSTLIKISDFLNITIDEMIDDYKIIKSKPLK
ncbi:MAG: hypothetical protein ACD_4C00101G0010 [uncultured bacterium (gcode 4)]|uniref:HTH cro/C1-type domain-containing protein n=1 Tax=uncultured bacterium (gcode 4) TaxID=1234023 RepID=K2FVI1_9BACT|nr:MAG: hypothetical protein ACD_4C00101G0010 [uncultured bacterium (gcode 4)]